MGSIGGMVNESCTEDVSFRQASGPGPAGLSLQDDHIEVDRSATSVHCLGLESGGPGPVPMVQVNDHVSVAPL